MITAIFSIFAFISYAMGFEAYSTAPAITQQMAGLIFGVIGTLFLTAAAIVYAINDAAKKAAPSPKEIDVTRLTTKSIHPNEIR